MRAEPGDRVVRVRYASPSLNTEIADTLFSFPPREGLEELVIEQYPVGGGGSRRHVAVVGAASSRWRSRRRARLPSVSGEQIACARATAWSRR